MNERKDDKLWAINSNATWNSVWKISYKLVELRTLSNVTFLVRWAYKLSTIS